jgi:hypothetical protein
VSAMTLLRAVLSCIANYLWRIPTVSPKRAPARARANYTTYLAKLDW